MGLFWKKKNKYSKKKSSNFTSADTFQSYENTNSMWDTTGSGDNNEIKFNSETLDDKMGNTNYYTMYTDYSTNESENQYNTKEDFKSMNNYTKNSNQSNSKSSKDITNQKSNSINNKNQSNYNVKMNNSNKNNSMKSFIKTKEKNHDQNIDINQRVSNKENYLNDKDLIMLTDTNLTNSSSKSYESERGSYKDLSFSKLSRHLPLSEESLRLSQLNHKGDECYSGNASYRSNTNSSTSSKKRNAKSNYIVEDVNLDKKEEKINKKVSVEQQISILFPDDATQITDLTSVSRRPPINTAPPLSNPTPAESDLIGQLKIVENSNHNRHTVDYVQQELKNHNITHNTDSNKQNNNYQDVKNLSRKTNDQNYSNLQTNMKNSQKSKLDEKVLESNKTPQTFVSPLNNLTGSVISIQNNDDNGSYIYAPTVLFTEGRDHENFIGKTNTNDNKLKSELQNTYSKSLVGIPNQSKEKKVTLVWDENNLAGTSVMERFGNATNSQFKKENNTSLPVWVSGNIIEISKSDRQRERDMYLNPPKSPQSLAGTIFQFQNLFKNKSAETPIDYALNKAAIGYPDAFQNIEIRVSAVAFRSWDSSSLKIWSELFGLVTADDKIQAEQTLNKIKEEGPGISIGILDPFDRLVSTWYSLYDAALSNSQNKMKSLFGATKYRVQLPIDRSIFIPLEQPLPGSPEITVPIDLDLLLQSNTNEALAAARFQVSVTLKNNKWHLASSELIKATDNSSDGAHHIKANVKNVPLYRADQKLPIIGESGEKNKFLEDLAIVGKVYLRCMQISDPKVENKIGMIEKSSPIKKYLSETKISDSVIDSDVNVSLYIPLENKNKVDLLQDSFDSNFLSSPVLSDSDLYESSQNKNIFNNLKSKERRKTNPPNFNSLESSTQKQFDINKYDTDTLISPIFSITRNSGSIEPQNSYNKKSLSSKDNGKNTVFSNFEFENSIDKSNFSSVISDSKNQYSNINNREINKSEIFNDIEKKSDYFKRIDNPSSNNLNNSNSGEIYSIDKQLFYNSNKSNEKTTNNQLYNEKIQENSIKSTPLFPTTFFDDNNKLVNSNTFKENSPTYESSSWYRLSKVTDKSLSSNYKDITSNDYDKTSYSSLIKSEKQDS